MPEGVTGGVVGGILRPRHRLPATASARPGDRAGPGGDTRAHHRPGAGGIPRQADLSEDGAVRPLEWDGHLEAVVGTDGCVESVKILRSRHLLLDKASEEALLQWRYSPLVLDGIPTLFVLTVTFNFNVEK